jgi:hypothetical protein
MSSIETEVLTGDVIGLAETLGDDERETYELVEDLASSIVFSRFPERREAAQAYLNRFLGTSVQVYRMTSEGEVFVYIVFNENEDGYFFVGSYPDAQPAFETVPTQRELDALHGRSQSMSGEVPAPTLPPSPSPSV